jgi:hypothetical protein
MPCIADINLVRKVVLRQKKKTNEKMKDLTVDFATHSKYGTLSRPQKRQAEHDMDRVNQEKNLQNDVRKASVIAARVAQVLEKMRQETNKIKNHLGNYHMVNTVGQDSSSSGTISDDLTTDIGTRQAWIQELNHMITIAYQYLEAQYLGDYTILHASHAASSDCPTSSCPKVYRPVFHYATPTGDCLSMPTGMGGAYTEIDANPSTDPTNSAYTASSDYKTAPSASRHMQVTNCDLDFKKAYHMFVLQSPTYWQEYIKGHFNDAIDPEKNGTYADAETADLQAASDAADPLDEDPPTVNTQRIASIKVYLESVVSVLLVAVILAPFDADGVTVATAENIDSTSHDHVYSTQNIEDEGDLCFITDYFVTKMNTIRTCQENNDREQQVLEFVDETSKSNESFHQDSFNELTHVDQSQSKAQYAVGKQLCHELDELYEEVCVDKQSFFGANFID